MKHTGDSSTNLMRKTDTNTVEKERSPELAGTEETSAPVTGHMGCGFGGCRPRFLQIFANPIIFMVILNIYCLVEGAIVSGKPTVMYASYMGQPIYVLCRAIYDPEHTVLNKKHVSAT